MNVKLMEKLKSRLNLDSRPLTFYTRGFNSNSDEVMSCDSTVRLSLKCPISMARQTLPVRTKKCRHLQTWDLQSFVDVMTESDKIKLYSDIFKQVKCPVCKINGPLALDPITKRLLTEFPAVDTLVIDHKGDARAAPETDVSIITISDSSHLATPEKGAKTESENKDRFRGFVVVIKRSGAEHSTFPLVNKECLLGRSAGCDIRIQQSTVSKEHCKLMVDNVNTKVYIHALSKTNPTKLNGVQLANDAGAVALQHKDVFTIAGQDFRWEYPEEIARNNQSSQNNPTLNSIIDTSSVTKFYSNAASSSANQTSSKSYSGAASQSSLGSQVNLDRVNDMLRLSKVKHSKGQEYGKTVKIGDILQGKSKVKRLGEGTKRPLTLRVGSNNCSKPSNKNTTKSKDENAPSKTTKNLQRSRGGRASPRPYYSYQTRQNSDFQGNPSWSQQQNQGWGGSYKSYLFQGNNSSAEWSGHDHSYKNGAGYSRGSWTGAYINPSYSSNGLDLTSYWAFDKNYSKWY